MGRHDKGKSGKRNENNKNEKVRFLIICEGEKTEKLYFKKMIEDYNTSKVIDIKVEGVGRGTVQLVKEATKRQKEIEISNAVKLDYVWVVFDKDDFDDFNEAISLAKKNGMEVAWSNEAFELWYLLHFIYFDSKVSRTSYYEKLTNIIREKGMENFEYDKKDPNMYSILKEFGNVERAKKYANKLRENYNDINYKTHNPCTYVDLLVSKLEELKSSL